MWKHFRGRLLLAVLGLIPVGILATPAAAGIFSRGCQNCQRPVNHCHCQSHQPQIETQMVPQQVTTYRNEVVTQYRQEAVTQSVPVTTYRDVIVDEGSYQTVYVPKQIAKRIPEVTYQQQTAYRSVPFQVTRQVPQVTTQLVPRQVVRDQTYSFRTTQTAPSAAAPVVKPSVPVYSSYMPMAVAPCGPCGGLSYAPAPVYQSVPMLGQRQLGATVIAAPLAANPVTMLPPTSAASAAVTADSSSPSIPVPDPKFLDSPGAVRDTWTTVGSRPDRSSDSGASIASSSNSSGVRFKPARSVHRSWETQSRVAAGDGPERR